MPDACSLCVEPGVQSGSRPHAEVAIVIPCVSVGALTRKCVDACSRAFPLAEILVLADLKSVNDSALPASARIVVTGPITIAAKRNRGARETARPIVAFIDSDAFPAPSWLDVGAVALKDHPAAGAVAGPNVSPPAEPASERIVGAALRSQFGSHNANYIKRPASPRFVDNVPTVNLIVRRDEYLAMGGMDERLFGGEDVEFCARLAHQGRRILYQPEVLVYHKNRSLAEFALQRLAYGGFAMENLLKGSEWGVTTRVNRTILISQLPTAFVMFLLSGVVILIEPIWAYVWLPVALIYLVTILSEAWRHANRPTDIPGVAAALIVATLAPGVGALARLIGLLPRFRTFYRNDR
jgi:GT2 family glycosyltransferase